jgi:L,D-transpeptidase ErfK/SrfK
MTNDNKNLITRRFFNRSLAAGVGATATGLASPALAQAVIIPEEEVVSTATRNISSFAAQSWEPYFKNLKNGAILSDTVSRVLHFWSEDGKTYKLYPTSVPLSDQLTRRGRTRIVRKKVGPDWRPTPNMLKRNPDWPKYWAPGPDNPLGTHALYLSWTYYRIHGTNDTRKIGRKSSNGCIGLYNEKIAELYELTKVGTQVLLI